VPYQAILGVREADNDAISLRLRTGNHSTQLHSYRAGTMRITTTITQRDRDL